VACEPEEQRVLVGLRSRQPVHVLEPVRLGTAIPRLEPGGAERGQGRSDDRPCRGLRDVRVRHWTFPQRTGSVVTVAPGRMPCLAQEAGGREPHRPPPEPSFGQAERTGGAWPASCRRSRALFLDVPGPHMPVVGEEPFLHARTITTASIQKAWGRPPRFSASRNCSGASLASSPAASATSPSDGRPIPSGCTSSPSRLSRRSKLGGGLDDLLQCLSQQSIAPAKSALEAGGARARSTSRMR
jgi:hypothetical protein